MKTNWFKYVFFVIIVILIAFAVFIFKKEENEKQIEEAQNTNMQKDKITEIRLGIARI